MISSVTDHVVYRGHELTWSVERNIVNMVNTDMHDQFSDRDSSEGYSDLSDSEAATEWGIGC